VTHPGVEVALLAWLADWSGHWPLLDRLAVMLADNDLFEATPFVTVLVAFWYSRPMRRRLSARGEVIMGLLAAALAVIVSRLIQNRLPTVRPIWHPVHGALFPAGAERLIDVSYHSFPSDHASFLVPLVWTVWRLDARLGTVGAVWLAFISLIRVYLGLHYPIDLVGGAIMGALATLAVRMTLGRTRERAVALIGSGERRWPRLTAAAFFVVSFQFATLFVSLRNVGSRMLHFLAMPH
jgi:undecaprenyl-diphosphatase